MEVCSGEREREREDMIVISNFVLLLFSIVVDHVVCVGPELRCEEDRS